MADAESQISMNEFDGPVVTCWACSILVAVPLGDDAVAAPVFKCGWCGAVNDLQQRLEDKVVASGHKYQPWQHQQQQQQQLQQQGYSLHLPSAHKQQHSSSFKQCRSRLATHARYLGSVCMISCRWTVVALVAMLVASIAGTGIIFLLPLLCTTWATYLPNLAVSLYLCICVAVNYTAAVLRSPGRVSECVPPPPHGPNGQVLQGAYELYSFCRHCRAAKPPAVHHCSACRQCVVDMDHHCPFINNCVGRGNLRPFLLLLLWAMLAAAYVLSMCSVLVWREWGVVRESVQLHNSLSRSSTRPPSSGSSNFNSSLPDVAGVLASPAAPSAAGLTSSSSSSVHQAAAGQLAADARWPSARLVVGGGMLLLLLQLAPGWLLATYYLAAASVALLLAVGVLLASQLSYLGNGLTYIQYLKRSADCAAEAGSKDGAAAAGTASWAEHQLQAFGNGRHCDALQQCGAEQRDNEGLATAAGAGGLGAWKQQQPQHALQRQPGKWQVLWSRVREVLGADSGSGFGLSRALLVPRWQPVALAGTAAGVKKWS
ncbi:DHHC palmitoyltransferase-domain-containing protein [Scenedesmus sp. NREL 46B-D3]|nr:DHHC palmitoyltransferase-domain-containing protein [Scenedesmus sp. NREL 46B-D3]